MHDALGDRMKRQYEHRTRYMLPRRTYTIVRVDGRAFHTYTRGMNEPFDTDLICMMNEVAKSMCESMDGACAAFTQSDEISILLTDFATPTTEAWFDGNLQKLTSLSASLATAHFNAKTSYGMALFDGRTFTIPDPVEVENYFIWRQNDATRNSIIMAAQAVFSHKELQHKSCDQMQEMLWQTHKINWNDYPVGCKRGRAVARRTTMKPVEYQHGKTGETVVLDPVERHVWEIEEPPQFTKDRAYLRALIPPLPTLVSQESTEYEDDSSPPISAQQGSSARAEVDQKEESRGGGGGVLGASRDEVGAMKLDVEGGRH